MNISTELEFIRLFIREEKRDRLALFASKDKTRDKMIRAMNSPGIFDPRLLTQIEGADRSLSRLLATYTKNGMGETVYVISEKHDWDGTDMRLSDILNLSLGAGIDVIGFCRHSKTAFYEWHHSGASYFLRSRTEG